MTKPELVAFYRRYNAGFHGVAPTGRPVGTPEFAVYRIDAGRIAEVWGMAFHVPLLEQIR